METIRVELGPRAYPIQLLEPGEPLGARLTGTLRSRRALIVADSNTAPIAERLSAELAGWSVERATIPAGETSKSFVELTRLYDALAAMRADRQTTIVAVGGGVVGDLAGFAAATYNRGLPLVMIPTSLLAMVDSSVGGKTGINHPAGKNLIGAFHQPTLVVIDTTILEPLPAREFRSGLAEVVKYGVIADAPFFAWLEEHIAEIVAREPAAVRHIVRRSCEIKAQVVEQDEFERTGLRAILNYGHTFGHAFEAVAGYGSWSHGEAVAAGMIHASRLGAILGRTSIELTARQERLLEAFELPIARDPSWNVEELMTAMGRDKKATSAGLRYVLPARLGHVELVEQVPEEAVRRALG
ncbi:MAG: 3-dehydroquinate synthase [Gemmataceae bacterium]